jgi:acetyl esterase/lipase
MGRRSDVPTAGLPETAVAVGGLAGRLGVALATLPLHRPWEGPDDLPHNLAQSATRRVMQSFFSYTAELPQPSLRSVEVVVDDVCQVVLPPFVHRMAVDIDRDEVGGVRGEWYRPRHAKARGTILYLHGGGYIGTSPMMYAAFTGFLARETACDVFVPDYRLAPEFPFPAAMIDVVDVLGALLHKRGVLASQLILAGDSGGGGLVTTVLQNAHTMQLPRPAASVLFSPEVDLTLDEPSVTENVGDDILPAQIPVEAYLHGHDPHDGLVSAIYADVSDFPPTLVAFGDEEMFRDPIRAYVEKLRSSGVETVSVEEPDMFHMYPILMPWADASRRLYREIAKFADTHLEPC